MNTAESTQAIWLPGFEQAVEGDPFSYHSPNPDVSHSLLVRHNSARPAIAWRTAVVPAEPVTEFVHFVWMFGLDINPERHIFHLQVNGRPCLDFENPTGAEPREWRADGEDGAELTFRTTLIDRHEDSMGYAVLRLPRTVLEPGRPVELRITGEAAESPVWYMTFQHRVTETTTWFQEPTVRKTDQGLKQTVVVNLGHLGPPGSGALSAPGLEPMAFELFPGDQQVRLELPAVTEATNLPLELTGAGRQAEQLAIELFPVRPWTVNLVTHTHTDIGYTRPQSEILPEHLRFIDDALDYCDQTDHYPDDARFRWTCETAWAVREYLRRRPQSQIERLVRRVREGRIEVTGMFLNMAEILDENLLAVQLETLREFADAGIPVTTLMQNDVNGLGWSLVDHFADAGGKYVTMGEHGHRALIPFDQPTAFWWESPGGNRLLAYRPDHYNTGNFWGIQTGNRELITTGLLAYLRGLEGKDYPYDRIAVQYSGYFTDNSPPSLLACDFVKEWNERYEWPQLRCATAREFPAYIAADHGNDLQHFRQAWPDWWTDGFGSSQRETAIARQTHAHCIAASGLLAQAVLLGAELPANIPQALERATDALLFFDEHTFGAAESISDPLGRNSLEQWGEKTTYAWDARQHTRLLQEEALGLLAPHLPRADCPTVTVLNTLGWTRSGPTVAYIDHGLLAPDQPVIFVDEAGDELPAQPMNSRPDGTYWQLWVHDVPAFGFRTVRILTGAGRPTDPPAAITPTRLENRFYTLEIDPATGGIRSLRDKELDLELVDPDSEWRLGQLIHERIPSRRDLELFTLSDVTRTPWSNIRITPGESGPLWQSVIVTGDSEAATAGGVSCEIRLLDTTKQIDFLFRLHKKEEHEPEAVYVAFPLAPSFTEHIFEAQGGVVRPGLDQLEGTASDWSTVQSFAAVRGAAGQVILSSNDLPLWQIGGLNLGNFQYHAEPASSHLFSWVCNNYWVTNFKASQRGELNWQYSLTSLDDPSSAAATRFGWNCRVPLVARVQQPVAPEQAPDQSLEPRSLLPFDLQSALLVAARPDHDGAGIILHLRELEGRAITFPESANGWVVQRVNVLGEPLGGSGSPRLAPLESGLFRVCRGE
ncbi:MAG: glycoside hydrolase family 38 C-terminal domain-containing protein [bacterium]